MFTLHQLPEEWRKPGQTPAAKATPPTRHGSRRCTRTRCVRPRPARAYDPPTPKHFSFNAPAGRVSGLPRPRPEDGFRRGISSCRIPTMPLESAIQPWRRAGKRMNIYYKAMLRSRRRAFQRGPGHAVEGFAGGFQDSPAAWLRRGQCGIQILARAAKSARIDRPFEGVLPNLERLATDSESEFIRNRLKAYMSPAVLRCLQRQAPEAGNPGGDAWASKSPARKSGAGNRETQDPGPVHHGRLRACRWRRRMNFSPRSS